jgi:peptidoglycan/LPS O-acetylase OafA/YrhL
MSTTRYDTLDGWRGLAALAIAFYHVPIAHGLREWGGWKNLEFFVDFFFVLSGFVICHAWGHRIASRADAWRFMVRRFWRVWPLHIIILFVFVALEVARFVAARGAGIVVGEEAFTGSTSLGALLSNIVLMQSLNLHGTTTWNGPAWSISVEFWTYLAFAGVMLLAGGRLWVMVLVAGAGALLIALLSPIWLFATHDFGLPRALYGFFAGAIAYRLVAGRATGLGGTAREILAIALMALWMAFTGANATSLLAPFVFVVLVLVFAEARGRVSGLIQSRAVQALGLWSYSIYLVHTLIYYVMRLVLVAAEKKLGFTFTASGSGSSRIFTFGSPTLDLAAIVALLALTVFISAFTYRWIEKPFMAGASRPALGKEPAAA